MPKSFLNLCVLSFNFNFFINNLIIISPTFISLCELSVPIFNSYNRFGSLQFLIFSTKKSVINSNKISCDSIAFGNIIPSTAKPISSSK